MKVLVIGKSGQLAQALKHDAPDRVMCLGRPELDIRRREDLLNAITHYRPDFVLNASAYTKVDQAEAEPDLAYAVNRDGPRLLAEICETHSLPLVHVSTDCVFDGTLDRPYQASDIARPLGVYGHSKLEGENAVLNAASRSLVVRVSWVFSEFGTSFVRTMLNLARTRDAVTVVNDQIGFPTYAPWLAKGLLAMADTCVSNDEGWGTYHLAGDESLSRSDMAEFIFAESRRLGGQSAEVIGVPTAEYKTPAERPLNARLGSSETMARFNFDQSDWRAGLTRTVTTILGEG